MFVWGVSREKSHTDTAAASLVGRMVGVDSAGQAR